MTILKNNITLVPFMSDTKSLSVGLNPLGMRTASEQLFSTLLPGMNVVTLRIRYYSFYCWLLKLFYAKKEGASLADLRKHIRMSELLMALIHAQSNQSSGVPGITYATTMINGENDIFDIVMGALPNQKATGGYWKGPLGALGTYYIASLQEMGLVSPLINDTKLYNITKGDDETFITGEKLAEAFESCIGKDNAALFERCVNFGKVSRMELAQMEDAFQSHTMPDTEESRMLLKMILQSDRPSSGINSYMRKNTLFLLLQYLDENNVDSLSELEFSRYVYKEYKMGNIDNIAAVGWYAYFLNDGRQFEALNIFTELLKRLQKSNKPGKWENIDEFTTQLADEVCEELCVVNEFLEEVFAKWNSIECPKGKIAHGFYMIFDDYNSNKNYQANKDLLREFFPGVHNDAIDSFDILERHLTEPFKNYIKIFLTDNIIYNHYSESMRKFSQNGIPTQKLTIENGYVRWLENYESTHSSPRVNTLFNFVTDLGLIAKYKVTAKGKELIKQLEK